MAEENNQENAATTGDEQAPMFQLQKLYVKDVSFEVPNAPKVFQESGESEVKLNLNQRANDIGKDLYEVVLTITVTASAKDSTVYLAEVSQAGLFMISGFNDQAHHAALNTMCPATLFPYARTVVTNLVTDGGFPPLVLQPINFDAIYGQRLQQAKTDAEAETADAEA